MYSIAAVIPLFNGSRWIADCLSSVRAQTIPPNEIIVIDDGSTDDGAAIAARHNVIVLHKPNGGQSSARNFGARHSISDLIAFLDQDDLWLPRHLELLREPFLQNPALGWSFSDVAKIDADGIIIETDVLRRRSRDHTRLSIAESARRDMFILPSAALISRLAFEGVGGFDERLRGYEDDDLFFRMQQRYHNTFVQAVLSQWRFHEARSSHTDYMRSSRRIYFGKLMRTHPGLFYAFGPRFLRVFIANIAKRHFGLRDGAYTEFLSRVRSQL